MTGYRHCAFMRLIRLISVVAIPTHVSAQIEVGATAQVSSMIPNAAHTEAFIIAHPTDVKRLAACSMVVDPARNRITSALYLSENRGATWRLAVHDTVSRLGTAWDPTCGFAPDSVVLFATLPEQSDPLAKELDDVTRVFRSNDNGRTWAKRLDAQWLDNEDLAVDWTTGPYRGRAYMVGVRVKRSVPGRRYLSLIYSADGGKSFSNAIDRFPDSATRQGAVGAPIVAADGGLLVPVTIQRERSAAPPDGTAPVLDQTVALIRITDGGTKFDAPATIAEYKPCVSNSSTPVVAVDRTAGPFRNRTYVVFADATQGRCEIKLSWSDDGKFWSPALPVDDPPVPLDPDTGPDAFFPQVAVNANGIVGISWYDRREDARNREFRQRFTASADGGNSVLRSVPVSKYSYHYAASTGPEPLIALGIRFADSTGATWIAAATGGAARVYYEVGDYGGLAVRADGAFQPIWIDNRRGVPQLFTAPISVTVRAMRPEERDRARGRDVSKLVLVAVTSTTFDAASCTVHLGFEATNVSDRPLKLPLTIRVENMFSQLGVPVAMESQSDDLGRPLWEIGGKGQLPVRETIKHSARFKLEECRPLAGRGQFAYRYPLDARLQGTPPARVAGPKILAVKLRVFERP